MECYSCGNVNSSVLIHTERLPCSHCASYIIVDFHLCKNCGVVWRSIDGQVDPDSFITVEERTFFDNDHMENALSKLAVRYDELSAEAPDGMSGYIHRCLDCNAISFEISKNVYECPKCGCRWEIT